MQIDNKKLENYISKLQPTECPLCGNGNWVFSDKIFQLLEFDQNGIVLGGSVFPVLPLTCKKCGNTYFINVLQANLIDKQEEMKDKKDGSNGK